MSASRKQKKTYQVRNWSQYNKALVNRGNITLWFDEEVINQWEHANKGFKVGRPFNYSDTAILALLMLREFFQLPYRQTEGFGNALVAMMGLEIAIPHHTSLVKRAKKLDVSIEVAAAPKGPVSVVVDSTGLKVFGEGEWKVRVHGADHRRTWRKIHLAIDPNSHQIVAEELTGNDCHDSEKALELVDQSKAEVDTFYGDGAYDSWNVHDGLQGREIDAIIPPRRGAVIKQHGNCKDDPLPRDECVRHIRRDGRKAWKEQIGYHQRTIAETAMSRMKGAFGGKLKNRTLESQKTEATIRCKLLNWFVLLGMPLSFWG